MFNTFAITGLILLGALLVYAWTQPDRFHILRRTSIKAPPRRIFALISDFHNWDAWSPYEHIDPAMKRAFSGPARGKGAVYEWESSSNRAGTGRLEIIDSSPPFKIVIQLDLAKPFEISSIVEFILETQDDETQVTWNMHGSNPFIGKMMGILYDRNGKVGQDFEEGLANLKAIAER